MFSLEPLCQGLCGSQKYTAMPVCSLSFSCMLISLPWVCVMLRRIGWAMPSSLSVKPCKTLAALAGYLVVTLPEKVAVQSRFEFNVVDDRRLGFRWGPPAAGELRRALPIPCTCEDAAEGALASNGCTPKANSSVL